MDMPPSFEKSKLADCSKLIAGWKQVILASRRKQIKQFILHLNLLNFKWITQLHTCLCCTGVSA
jgi:hypothetical protein